MGLITNYFVPSGVNIAPLLNDPYVTSQVRSIPYEVIRGYVNVKTFSWESNMVTFHLDFKKNKDADPVMSKTYTFEPDISATAPIIHVQIYEYLKSLPEFAGAEDDY